MLGLMSGFAPAQSPEPDPAVGYLRVISDTDKLQVFLDGKQIGYTPFRERLTVTPGWHSVSYFAPDFPWQHWTHRQQKMMDEVVKAGTRQVLVRPGEEARVELAWQGIGERLESYESSRRIGTYVGMAMIATTLVLITWAQ